MAKTPRSNIPARTRADGRKSLLVYLHPDVIKELKKAALDEDRTAYVITEEAVSAWLAARKGKRQGQRRMKKNDD
jgi:hypothetical protein